MSDNFQTLPILYGCTKTYTHSVGLSCVFRQWRAESHCRHLHGYALKITLDFASFVPDENGWVVDFGGLAAIKQKLVRTFDHKLLIAQDDPMGGALQELSGKDLADVVIVPATGCENFARLIMSMVDEWLAKYGERVRLRKVTVAEHDGNSAYVERRVL